MKKGQKSFNIKNKDLLISLIYIPLLAYIIYQYNLLNSILPIFLKHPVYFSLIPVWVFYGYFLTKKKIFRRKINEEQKIRIGTYLLILTFFVFYQMLFFGNVPIIFASTTAGCGIYSGSGDWTISSSCTISGGQCVTVSNGNLIISSGGSLTLTDVNSRVIIDTSGKYVSVASGTTITVGAGTCIKFVSGGTCGTVNC